jgi:hypothetical protein
MPNPTKRRRARRRSRRNSRDEDRDRDNADDDSRHEYEAVFLYVVKATTAGANARRPSGAKPSSPVDGPTPEKTLWRPL